MKTIWKYEAHLPAVPPEYRLLLGEGQTPLVKSGAIAARLGVRELYFKLENLNPTGSYKDRFAAVLVSEMRAAGQKVCIATSSGNTGAALSAYCAASGIACMLVVVDGAPSPKIMQMQLYGAQILMVRDFGKNAEATIRVFDQLETLCRAHRLPLPVSAYRYCPSAMRGVQTLVYEIGEQLAGGPDHIFVPAGGGGLTLAVAKGVLAAGKPSRVHCVQPQGNDTIASCLRSGEPTARAVPSSVTRVSGLQVANVIDGDQVVAHCRQLGGNGYVVSDEAVFGWQKAMAQQEGIFCEPAGAVALAGLENALLRGEINPEERIVCLVTGSGFKDMAAVDMHFGLPVVAARGEAESMAVIDSFLQQN